MASQMIVTAESTEVAMVTFGGKSVFTMLRNEPLYYNFIITKNKYFTVLQSGLNYYVIGTPDFKEQ